MSTTDDLFKASAASMGKHTIESLNNNGREGAFAKGFLNALLIMLLAGAEGMKVIVRNNFGKGGIHIGKIIVCSLSFALLSFLLFTGNNFGQFLDDTRSTQISSIITAIIFVGLSLLILVKGIISKVKAGNENPLSVSQGDSRLLDFLSDFGFEQKTIQNFFEPFYIIIIGTLFFVYNIIGGITILFCGLSFWIHILIDGSNGNSTDKMKQEMQSARRQKTIINNVSSD